MAQPGGTPWTLPLDLYYQGMQCEMVAAPWPVQDGASMVTDGLCTVGFQTGSGEDRDVHGWLYNYSACVPSTITARPKSYLDAYAGTDRYVLVVPSLAHGILLPEGKFGNTQARAARGTVFRPMEAAIEGTKGLGPLADVGAYPEVFPSKCDDAHATLYTQAPIEDTLELGAIIDFVEQNDAGTYVYVVKPAVGYTCTTLALARVLVTLKEVDGVWGGTWYNYTFEVEGAGLKQTPWLKQALAGEPERPTGPRGAKIRAELVPMVTGVAVPIMAAAKELLCGDPAALDRPNNPWSLYDSWECVLPKTQVQLATELPEGWDTTQWASMGFYALKNTVRGELTSQAENAAWRSSRTSGYYPHVYSATIRLKLAEHADPIRAAYFLVRHFGGVNERGVGAGAGAGAVPAPDPRNPVFAKARAHLEWIAQLGFLLKAEAEAGAGTEAGAGAGVVAEAEVETGAGIEGEVGGALDVDGFAVPAGGVDDGMGE